MTDKVEMLLRKELINNKEQMLAFINHPRRPKKLSIVPDKEKQKLPFDNILKKQTPDEAEMRRKLKKEAMINHDDEGIASMHFKQMRGGLDFVEQMVLLLYVKLKLFSPSNLGIDGNTRKR